MILTLLLLAVAIVPQFAVVATARALRVVDCDDLTSRFASATTLTFL